MMRKLFCLLLLCFQTLCSSFIAIQHEGLEIDVGMGYRKDDFNWSIAGPNGHPDVLSELSWRNMESFLIQANLRWAFKNHFYVRGMADYGKIQDGHVQDSDYLRDHHRGEFLRSISDARNGRVFDLSLGLGYLLEIDCRFAIAPMIGFSQNEQHLRMHNGELVFNLFNPGDVGGIHGLHSSYKASWTGPWVGADTIFHVNPCWSLFGSLEYHVANYKGRGHWNLRDDFLDDFIQKAHGHGVVTTLGTAYTNCDRWFISLVGGYQAWNTGRGSDRLKVLTNAGPMKIHSRLNKVHWHAASLILTWGYRF